MGRPRRTNDDKVIVAAAISSANASARRLVETRLGDLNLDDIEIEIRHEEKWVTGVTNDPELVRQAQASVASVVGPDGVSLLNRFNAAFGEDFGSFQQHVPGVMFFLGVSNPAEGWVGMPHSSDYMADEKSIFVGARAMSAVALDLLSAR